MLACCTCRPLHFRNACLAPVFVVIIIAALAQDQHVGTRIQVTALLLGPAWLAVLLAIATVSSSRPRCRAAGTAAVRCCCYHHSLGQRQLPQLLPPSDS
jgi:hypothetical protein